MRPVSSAFLDAVTGSHTMAVRARAVPYGQTGVSPSGGVTLPPTGGDVQYDAAADIRATIDLTISATDPDTGSALWPANASSALTPYGAYELFVERGIAFGGGSIEYVGLGYFRIDNVDQPDAPDGPIRLNGKDRMAMVVDSKLTTPVVFSASDTVGDLVQTLVDGAIDGVTIEWDDGTASEPIGRSGFTENDNRYGFFKEIITGVGKIGYFDHRGILVIRTPPDPRARPSWVVSRGRGGVLVSASRSLSREGVANGVLASGESVDTEPPVSALVVDNDPASPTRWGGPFGRIAKPFASPLLTTSAQCQLAGATVLRRSIGLPYNVDFDAVPNPALEVEDVLAIGIEGVPVQRKPLLIHGDSFTRTVVDGLGMAETGAAYSFNNSSMQVNSGTFKRTIASANSYSVPFVLNERVRNARAYVDVRAPVTAIGGDLGVGLSMRAADSNDFYAAWIAFTISSTVNAAIVRRTTESASIDALDYSDGIGTYFSGDWWTICMEADGDLLRMKAWPRDTEPEPSEWLITTDAGAPFPESENRYGLYFLRYSGNSNVSPQYELDNYRVQSLPGSDLQGGEVHVLDSITIPLTAAGAMRGTTREQTLVSAEVIA